MKFSHSSVKLACKTKDYNMNDAPDEIALNPVLVDIEDNTIVDINEQKKTITVDIRMSFAWHDERINVFFSDEAGIIWLPPATTEEKPIIWNPFIQLEIENLKKRIYVQDPIILKMGLMDSKTANDISKHHSQKTFFHDLTSVVWAEIDWRVTVSCPFDFSSFPFDRNTCPLEIVLYFDWNLTIHNDQKHRTSYDADGFEIKTHEVGPRSDYKDHLALPLTIFGLDVHIKRDVSKYIFTYYLPSITIVLASSVSFIIPLSATPGRVALVVTLFLTLTNIFIHQMVSIISFFGIKQGVILIPVGTKSFQCIQSNNFHFQTDSPPGKGLTLLGAYLLISLVFVFFTMVEFAFVLAWREVNGQEVIENSMTKHESESENVISRKMTKQQNTITKVTPLVTMKHDLKEAGVTEQQPTIFRSNANKLTLARKIDFSSFLIYNFCYILFNFIYFVMCMSNNDIVE